MYYLQLPKTYEKFWIILIILITILIVIYYFYRSNENENFIVPRKRATRGRKRVFTPSRRDNMKEKDGETYISGGGQGKVYLGKDNKVRKRYFRESGFKTNVKALTILKGEPHIPKMYSNNIEEFEIVMDYCGKSLSRENAPEDVAEQLEKIDRILKKHNMANTDASSRNNYCVKDKTLYLVDWGYVDFKKSSNINIKRIAASLQAKK